MPKVKSRPATHLPPAPWIYINDPSGSHEHASRLASLIPKAAHFKLTQTLTESSHFLAAIKHSHFYDSILILSDNKNDLEESNKQVSAQILKENTIKHGCNFTSINLYTTKKSAHVDKWGTNHLELALGTSGATQTASVNTDAQRMYKWLFTVLTVTEQLYLIPDRQMQEIDKSSTFKDYTYCPISESRKHNKDAKIQFVALVLSKPAIGPNQRVQWQVADKTGVANFYFQYRGPSSQYTWDWVLSLKPGDRKCLPRMPLVQVKERTITTIIKSPFRASAVLIDNTGLALQSLGTNLRTASKKVKLGNRTAWITEADIITTTVIPKGKKGEIMKVLRDEKHAANVPIETKTEIKVFSEKGEKMWKDDDSVASTSAGSLLDEKVTKNFI